MDPEDEEIELQNGIEIEGQEQDIMMQNELIAVGKVNSVNGKTGDVVLTTSDLENDSDYQTGSEVESAISEAVADKQDKLTAGDNITIENNVISASDTTYTAGNGLSLNNENEFSVDTTVVATQQNLSTEVTNRENADINLQGQIDAISASSDVVDIVGTYAELQAYDTQHLKDNDIIKVLQDETQNNATTYYRWSTHTHTFTLIGQEGPYYTKASADAQFVPQTRTVNSKALSSNITLTASDVDAVATGDVVQATGNNTTKIMSQKATTDVLGLKLNISDYVVDNALADSTNPVQNKVLYELFSSMPSDFFTGPITVNGNGREITLAGTMNTKLSDVKMYGDTFQQAYSGKNLFDKSLYIGAYQSGYTELYDGIKVATTVGRSLTAYSAIQIPNSDSLLGKTVTLKIGSKIPSNNGSKNVVVYQSKGAASVYGQPIATLYEDTSQATFTFPASYTDDSTCFAILFYCNSANVDDYTEYKNIQLEVGSTATSYEPYVGGTASPNPDYPQDVNVVKGKQTVQVTGKNLFDLDTAVTQWESPQGTVYTSPAYVDGVVTVSWTVGANGRRLMAGFKPNLVAGTTYTLSAEVFLSGTNANSYVSMGSISSWGNIDVGEKDKWLIISKTFVATAEDVSDSRMLIQAANTGNTLKFKNVQLEQGSATTYEPYQGASYTVRLGSLELCKIGNYQDYIYKSGDDWYVHKETGKVVFDGSENWNYNNVNQVFGGSLEALFPLRTTTNPYCNNFIGQTTATYNQVLNKHISLQSTTTEGSQRVLVKDLDIEQSFVAFKTWLSSHNTTLYYPLATATDTKITNADLVSDLNALWNALSYDGQTNFAITASGLSAILDVTAFKKTLAGLIGAINR